MSAGLLPFGVDAWAAHVAAVLLIGIGLFVLVDDDNLVKKVVGLNILQTGVFLFFVTSAYQVGARTPLVSEPGPYANPLPQVLVLTAIVVGVAVTAVALALVVRIYDAYGTLREDVVRDIRAGERAVAAVPDGGTATVVADAANDAAPADPADRSTDTEGRP